MPTVAFRGTRRELADLLRAVPLVLSGRAPDPLGVARALQLRLGTALLSQVQQDFVRKSRGETGRDGVKWPPLKRETIARRRTGPGELKRLGVTGKRVRGLLTPAEDKRWRQIFGTRLAWLRNHMSEGEARARAAQIAWAVLKAAGAKTKLDVLGGRKVDILRDTGELLRSLSPGVDDRPSGADGQVFKVPSGRVIVGTNKKPWHQDGIPGKLPARRLWPVDGTIPPAWWEPVQKAGVRGLAKVIELLIANWRRGE